MKRDATMLRVRDLPTRVFHGVLALCVIGSVVSRPPKVPDVGHSPLRFVSGATSDAVTRWHNPFGQWLIIALAPAAAPLARRNVGLGA